jgi:hypothetical protein
VFTALYGFHVGVREDASTPSFDRLHQADQVLQWMKLSLAWKPEAGAWFQDRRRRPFNPFHADVTCA